MNRSEDMFAVKPHGPGANLAMEILCVTPEHPRYVICRDIVDDWKLNDQVPIDVALDILHHVYSVGIVRWNVPGHKRGLSIGIKTRPSKTGRVINFAPDAVATEEARCLAEAYWALRYRSLSEDECIQAQRDKRWAPISCDGIPSHKFAVEWRARMRRRGKDARWD